ncbi:hypothetical protein RQP46_002732 [Phenoliferia psychrophenolica]
MEGASDHHKTTGKKALDFSHHYSDAVAHLGPGYVPGKFDGRPGLLNLDGGIPATAYFPVDEDWDTLVTIGATASWGSVVRVLLNPGEGFLADSYAYNGALMQAAGTDARAVSVAMDSEGTSAKDLERVLSTWDEKARGFRRPRLMYTQGGLSNPTGQVIPLKRKKEIYEVCVKYDVIIAEDDPYRWQESGATYVLPEEAKKKAKLQALARGKTDEEWLGSVVPSFLAVDYQGRVIRIDTFSKTIGPGVRLGYFTTSPSLLRVLQSVAQGQAPSGLSQAIVGQLLHEYKQDGFARWLRGIAAQYELRRNWSIDTLSKHVRFEKNKTSGSLVAYKKAEEVMVEKKVPDSSLFSFVPPAGGMFCWFAIHLHNHPSFERLSSKGSPASAKTKLAAQLYDDLGEAGVLFRLGELFAVPTPEERAELGEDVIYLRAAYSYNTREELQKAFEIFAVVVTKFFRP